jgi:hypothetical protein
MTISVGVPNCKTKDEGDGVASNTCKEIRYESAGSESETLFDCDTRYYPGPCEGATRNSQGDLEEEKVV